MMLIILVEHPSVKSLSLSISMQSCVALLGLGATVTLLEECPDKLEYSNNSTNIENQGLHGQVGAMQIRVAFSCLSFLSIFSITRIGRKT